jgi:uncharacterized protein YjhX (UPF0386 family)
VKISQHFKNILLWLSQGGNVLVFKGSPDETTSARAYREGWWFRHVINLVFWDRNHCRDAYYDELARAHLPDDYKTNSVSL